MNETDLDHFKKIILEKKGQAAGDVEELERVSRIDGQQESSDDKSAYSLHMADRGTDAMEREKNMLFAQRGGEYLDYLDEAMQRIENKTFGICRICNGDIGHARLEAVPTATQCIECKSKGEEQPS
jgi:DnaK suppressor protein